MADNPYLYLTTFGHKSGNSHEIEIWYVQQGNCYYLVSEKREQAHWVQNIRANNQITFRVAGVTYNGKANIPTDDSLIIIVKAKMDDKYNWSDGLVVELCGEVV